ncbi:MAG: ABC transporter substrate-binding protein [Actinomycetota bacterium]|nr:ABC transporter substrate-binding protein [Actinomycetota bacterium]
MNPSLSSRHVRRLAMVGVVVVAGLVGASCQSSTRGLTPTAAKPPPDVLRVGVETPGSLDPAQARSPSEFLLAEQLFDGLTAYDSKSLAVKPSLAASWQPSADFAHWDFTLRPDAKFANGRPITSTDVKYSFERIAQKGSTSPAVSQLAVVTGYKQFNGTGKADNLAGITAPAPAVVHFDLDEPLSVLPLIVGNPIFGIVPKEAVEAPNPPFATQPVGSGPFTFQSRTDTVLRLVPAPDAKVSVKGLDVFLAKDAASAYADFLRGGVDWAEVPPDQVEPVPEAKGRDVITPYTGELFYAFNLKSPKFGDQRFREAIVHAVDRDAIGRVVYGSTVIPRSGLVAEGIPGAQPDPCGDVCRFDPGKAKDLLKQTFGDQPPPAFSIDYDENPTQEAVAEAMQANLKAVGITATPRPHVFGDYLSFAQSGDRDLFRLGWIGQYPSPDAFLTPLYQTGTVDNVTGFSSPVIDNLLKQGRGDPDEARRMASFQEAEKQILAQVPVVPIAQFRTHSVSAKRVENLVVTTMGTFDASQVKLSG